MLLYNKSYNLFDIQNIFAIDNYCAKISEVACQNVESKAWSSWRIKSVLLKVNWKIAKSPPHPALAEYVLVCQDCFYFFLSIAYEWCILTWPWVIDKKKSIIMGLKWTLTAWNIFNFLPFLYYSLRWCRFWEWHTCLFSCHLTQPPSLVPHITCISCMQYHIQHAVIDWPHTPFFDQNLVQR